MTPLYALLVFLTINGQEHAFNADSGLTLSDCRAAQQQITAKTDCRPMGEIRLFLPIPQRKPAR